MWGTNIQFSINSPWSQEYQKRWASSCLGCLPPDTDANEATCKEGRKRKEKEKKKEESKPNCPWTLLCCDSCDRNRSRGEHPSSAMLSFPHPQLAAPAPKALHSPRHPYSCHIGTVPISALDHEIPILLLLACVCSSCPP